MSEIYFDNSATTRPYEECARIVYDALLSDFANPSSLHRAGNDVRKKIEAAREEILKTLSADAQRYKLVFTGGGSEANNLAILGTLRSKKWHSKPKILAGAGEHPSVTNALLCAEAEGAEVVFISTAGGEIDMEMLAREADERVVFCTFMTVNNETGALYNVKEAFSAVRRRAPECVCHTDAVQAYLKTNLSVAALGADMISISAHKVHGPKGIGALIVNSDVLKRRLLSPVVYGGGQETGLRAGTENSPYILGFAASAKKAREEMPKLKSTALDLYEYIKKAVGELDGFSINEPKTRVNHIISITMPDIKSETMLHHLSAYGISVSSGSACSSHSQDTSPALAAFGLEREDADCTIRVSLCAQNTREEAERFIAALSEGASRLVRIRRTKRKK